MKWLAILLMIANVALYLWMSGLQGEVGVGDLPAKPEVNRSGMLLLNEIRKPAGEAVVAREPDIPPSGQPSPPTVSAAEDDDKAQSAPVATPERGAVAVRKAAPENGTAVGGNAAAPQGPTMEPAPATSAVTPAQQTIGQEAACFRVGPFKVKQRLNAVSSALRQEGVSFRVVQSKGRELKATRVYLGPYASRAEAGKIVKRLKTMGEDAYIYSTDQQLRVSVGYFTQKELATKYITALEQKDVQAKIEPEFKTLGPFDWLEIRARRDDAGSIKGRNWGEREVEVKSVACPA